MMRSNIANLPKERPGVTSWSRTLKILKCSMQNHIERDLGIKSVVKPVSLEYGTLLHDAVEAIIIADFAQFGFDCGVEALKDGLSDAVNNGMDLKGWTLEEYQLMGSIHAQNFMTWAKALQVETIGTEIEIKKSMEHGDTWIAKIDWAFAYRRYSRPVVGLIDHKTCGQAITDDFKFLDGQLAGYSELWKSSGYMDDENTEIRVGYTEFVKGKPQTSSSRKRKGPRFIEPSMKSVTEEAVSAFYGSIDAAVQLRSIKPFRAPGSAYNSPCGLCDVRHYCHTGELGPDLIKKER